MRYEIAIHRDNAFPTKCAVNAESTDVVYELLRGFREQLESYSHVIVEMNAHIYLFRSDEVHTITARNLDAEAGD